MLRLGRVAPLPLLVRLSGSHELKGGIPMTMQLVAELFQKPDGTWDYAMVQKDDGHVPRPIIEGDKLCDMCGEENAYLFLPDPNRAGDVAYEMGERCDTMHLNPKYADEFVAKVSALPKWILCQHCRRAILDRSTDVWIWHNYVRHRRVDARKGSFYRSRWRD